MTEENTLRDFPDSELDDIRGGGVFQTPAGGWGIAGQGVWKAPAGTESRATAKTRWTGSWTTTHATSDT